MAEPLDYFFQGANLGMRATQARIQNQQFKTNLAERARQFDLNRQIAEDNLELRRSEFTLAQERQTLAQKQAKVERETLRLQNQKQAKIFEEDGKYAPVVSEFLEQVQARPSSFSPMPPFPDNLPPRILNDLTEQADAINRMLAMNEASKAQEQAIEQKTKISTQMLTVAMQVDPSIIEEDARGIQFVRPEKYAASEKIQDYLNRPAKIQALQLEELNLRKELAQLKLDQEKNPPPAGIPRFIDWWNDLKNPELLDLDSQEEALRFYRSLYGIRTPNNQVIGFGEIDAQGLKMIPGLGSVVDPSLRKNLLLAPDTLLSPDGSNVVDKAVSPSTTQ